MKPKHRRIRNAILMATAVLAVAGTVAFVVSYAARPQIQTVVQTAMNNSAHKQIISKSKIPAVAYIENLEIDTIINDTQFRCLFSGTADNWKCDEFSYGDLNGALTIDDYEFNATVSSKNKMPSITKIYEQLNFLGKNGRIDFTYSDVVGTMEVRNGATRTTYRFAKNKTIEFINTGLYFLPESFSGARGNFIWADDTVSFVPENGRWSLGLSGTRFYIRGKNFKDFTPDSDLRFMNNYEYSVSGNVLNNNISDLEIEIAGHVFRGSATGNNITLQTELLNTDTFVSKQYLDNYDQLQYLMPAPLLLSFNLPANISLRANKIIYNGDTFANFVWTSKSAAQTFSITDDARGNLLCSITRGGGNYNIVLQLTKFAITDSLLNPGAPFNISDTTITGIANLSTFGKISFDIWYNLAGAIDFTMDGGTIFGIGTDDFYGGAKNITKLNAETYLARALDGGKSKLKSLHISGDYDGGDFVSAAPFELRLQHTDANGMIDITDGNISVDMNLTLRGTSPSPQPVALHIKNTVRRFSLSQIMIDFDSDFFRDFVAIHDRF